MRTAMSRTVSAMPLDFRTIRSFFRRTPRDPRGRVASAPAVTRLDRTHLRPAGTYPGDFAGQAALRYSPDLNGSPDPGEIVWTWVPFEEDHGRGKDRPVLLIGHDGSWLLGLMLTSKDRNNGHQHNGDYADIGAGQWDRQGRPSEVRLDRIVRIDPSAVRREGAVLDSGTFQAVARLLRKRHGWS